MIIKLTKIKFVFFVLVIFEHHYYDHNLIHPLSYEFKPVNIVATSLIEMCGYKRKPKVAPNPL